MPHWSSDIHSNEVYVVFLIRIWSKKNDQEPVWKRISSCWRRNSLENRLICCRSSHYRYNTTQNPSFSFPHSHLSLSAPDPTQSNLIRLTTTHTYTGLVLFIVGLTLWQTEGTSAFIGLFVLGLLVFIPGFHFTRLAWLAYTGRGSWKDLPDLPMSVDEY